MKNRIYVFTQKEVCENCKDSCAEFDGIKPDCSYCGYKELPHITQQKAVRVMADAMRFRGEQCSFTFSTLAEYGLRALLEAAK